MITAEFLRDVLSYDPETGWFIWKKKVSSKTVIGRRAGSINRAGYRVVGLGGQLYYAHRLAYLYMTGNWPERAIDHREGAKDDNRWSEIRAATPSENALNAKLAANNTSGFKGVSWHKAAGKWAAHINLCGRKRHLGLFDDPVTAHGAYMSAAAAASPEFARNQ